MKIKVIAFVVSFICISAARHIKWSPEVANDIEGKREIIREQIHKYWPQLGEVLGENDEEKVKQFLHQVFEMYRPTQEDLDGNVDQDDARPSRPFKHHHISRPSHDGHGKPKPLPHKDIQEPVDRVSGEVVDQAVARPLPQEHIMRPLQDAPVEVEEEMEKSSLPQKQIWIPLPAVPVDKEIKKSPFPQEHIIRPLHSAPAELDEEIKKLSARTKYAILYLYVPSAERDDEIEKSFPEKNIMRPLHDSPNELDVVIEELAPPTQEEIEQLSLSLPFMVLLPPALPAERDEEIEQLSLNMPFMVLPPSAAHDEENEKSFPQKEIVQQQEDVSGELKDKEMMKPFTYQCNKRPQHSVPINVDGELIQDTSNHF